MLLNKGQSFLIRVFVASVLVALQLCNLFQFSTRAQSPQGTPRKIVSDDFTKHRQTGSGGTTSSGPQGGRVQSNNKPRQQTKRTYRLASQTKADSLPKNQTAHVAQLGITIWRLRPVASKESTTSARMLVREKSKTAELVPVRVEADTTFREGDQIRLSIESPNTGYLYVVDRELFADGSMGPAMLIYPWSDKDGYDNRVRPGRLIDIPAQEDQPAYFTARRSVANQVGEVLTIIVTSSPLNLPISDKPIQISKAELSNWEKMWGGVNERFEMDGGAGEAWTSAEQQAAAHTGNRQLTREDPPPQTIYRVSGPDDKAFLVNVRLNY